MSKPYFTSETENAIIAYNATEDVIEKNTIFTEKIYYPFFKLTQNLIHTFKYYHTEVDNLEDLQHETIIFLMSKLHLFDPTKGFKAFSYFGTAAKRYLINTNDKVYRRKLESQSVDNVSDESRYLEDKMSKTSHDKLNFFINYWITYCDTYMDMYFKDDTDKKTADAVLELFRRRFMLEGFKKKVLYAGIREMVPGIKTSRITKVVTILYDKILWPHYTYYLEHDLLPKEYDAIEPYKPYEPEEPVVVIEEEE